MAHVQKPVFGFRRNGRVHLNRRGRQFSRLLAAEMCASAVVMLDTLCSEVVWRVLATHSIRQFPLHFPSRVSLCAITFQLESTSVQQHGSVLSNLLPCYNEAAFPELSGYSGWVFLTKFILQTNCTCTLFLRTSCLCCVLNNEADNRNKFPLVLEGLYANNTTAVYLLMFGLQVYRNRYCITVICLYLYTVRMVEVGIHCRWRLDQPVRMHILSTFKVRDVCWFVTYR